MMKMRSIKFVILAQLFLILYVEGYSQKYVTTTGDTLRIGDTLYVGKGSVNGSYKYIGGFFTPGEGGRVIIKGFSVKKDINYARIYIGGIAYAQVMIDPALETKELLVRRNVNGKLIQ